ncbi:hypothetical protein [Enterobacter cloacae]|uniref:hypothetical protein n=1 Tax=Enterobacter cloacae TaxID=550 RepID=UPI00188AD232|nr:hypothetical protein [Enterobacter cloacae]MBF4109429.1 hypothetical protein [Enterobacter cloacae]
MSNINKQAVQAVADLKSGYTLGHADVAILNELARIALASLEAEPAIHRWRRVTVEPYGPYPWHYGNFIGFSKPVEGIEDEYFYSAPPAPVSVPDFGALTKCIVQRLVDYGVADDDAIASAEEFVYNACRAAMLQGAEPVTTAYKLPEGWVAVPVEPTEDMIVNGFESEPDESFSDEKEWEAYDAMSGCQQSAHRAKLCWAAMISAAPKV